MTQIKKGKARGRGHFLHGDGSGGQLLLPVHIITGNTSLGAIQGKRIVGHARGEVVKKNRRGVLLRVLVFEPDDDARPNAILRRKGTNEFEVVRSS